MGGSCHYDTDGRATRALTRGGSESNESGNPRRGGETNDERKTGKTAENTREKERRRQDSKDLGDESRGMYPPQVASFGQSMC
jgi:hypothetical protein